MIDFAKLAAPFSPASISWRVGAKAANNATGLALAYIDARDVADRLDEVCGPAGWECDYPHAGQKTVCRIGILCDDRWVYKSNGAGDTDVEGEKGALSDAFKRAATMWGIGRYLYSFPAIWVKIRAQGRSFVIDESDYPKLIAAMDKHSKGIVVAPSLPPRHQDDDAANGHAQWVRDQKLVLQNLTNLEEVREWHAANKAAIDKLGRDNLPLHGDLKKAYAEARQRTDIGARLQ